jgi:folate-binding protein YgfZ
VDLPADYRAALEGAVLFELGWPITVQGEDARTFLHNLSTPDVKNLPVGDSCEAFFTTNKARVVAFARIHCCREGRFLIAPDGPGDTLVAHLNRFLISEKVEMIGHDPHGTVHYRLAGPRVPEMVDKRFVHRLLGMPGADLFIPNADDDADHELEQIFAAGAVRGSPETYEILRVEAGLPRFGIDIDENRLAMEVNRPQAISYNKGCYLGQETIVMARDRGQVNRLLMGVKLLPNTTDTSFLPAGARVMRGTDEVGQVTSSVFSPRLGQVIALAYLKRGSWDAGTEIVIEGRPGVVCALPFC